MKIVGLMPGGLLWFISFVLTCYILVASQIIKFNIMLLIFIFSFCLIFPPFFCFCHSFRSFDCHMNIFFDLPYKVYKDSHFFYCGLSHIRYVWMCIHDLLLQIDSQGVKYIPNGLYYANDTFGSPLFYIHV